MLPFVPWVLGPLFVNGSVCFILVSKVQLTSTVICLLFFWSRGVQQGCPLSPLVNVLSAKVLAVAVCSHPRIKGLYLPGSSCPLSAISQYANDTSLVVTSDEAICADLMSTICLKKVPVLK